MTKFPASDQDSSKQLEQLMSTATQMPQQLMQAFGGIFSPFTQGMNQAMQQVSQIGSQLASTWARRAKALAWLVSFPPTLSATRSARAARLWVPVGPPAALGQGWQMPPSRPETLGRHRFRQPEPTRPRRNRSRYPRVHPIRARERGGRWAAECR